MFQNMLYFNFLFLSFVSIWVSTIKIICPQKDNKKKKRGERQKEKYCGLKLRKF